VSLAWPLGLAGLLVLPLVWWLHRRLRRPSEVVLPSLMFLQDEADATSLPRGRRLDVELLLALMATALLALAAAGPCLVESRPVRVVRVAVDVRTARPDAAGYARRVLAAREAIAGAMAADDRLVVVGVPDVYEASTARRPAPETLLAAARAGEASVRLVVSDDAPPAETGGVHWIAVGDPQAANQGIVATSVRVEGETTHVSCTVANHAAEAVKLRLSLETIDVEGPVEIRRALPGVAPEGMCSQTLDVPTSIGRFHVRLQKADGTPLEDTMPQDDVVLLQRLVLPVFLDPLLPETHRRHVMQALRAVLGTGGVRFLDEAEAAGAAVAFLRRGTPLASPTAWALVLDPVREAAPIERAGPGAEGRGRAELAEDLSTASADWIYAAGASDVAPGERILLARHGARRLWPVLVQAGRRARLAPDPARGEPPAFEGPFWPLLVENLVRAAAGRGVGGGYRATGVLDPASSRPGRARLAFEPTWIRSVAPSIPGRSRPLRPWLIAGALACLALLWLAPRKRIRAMPARAA